MAFNDATQTIITDMTNVVKDIEVDSQQLDSTSDQGETTWTQSDWPEYYGFYRDIPELTAAIDAMATWTVGKGFQADPVTTLILDTIRGWGKDTFNTILENLVRTMLIGGDAFAEIIRDDQENIINLKPLNPRDIQIVVDRKGMIKRYERINRVNKQRPRRIPIEDIFHLARNRIGDQIHGTSVITACKWVIEARNEVMKDWRKVLHRNVVPLRIIEVDSTNSTKLAALKAEYEQAIRLGEVLIIPKGTVEIKNEPIILENPQQWINYLGNFFYEIVGVPKIIIGNAQELTEAAAKISYLTFQQRVEEEQLFIEENVLNQLNWVINLQFPASLENELLSDNKKDGPENIDPSDTTEGGVQ